MFNSAGMERVVANKATYFSKQAGYKVFVITTDQKNRPYYYELPQEVTCIDLDINFRDYQHYFILIRIFSYLYKSFIFKKRLAKFLISSKPDVVVSLLLRSSDFLYKIKDGSAKIIEHHFSHNYSELFSVAQNRDPLSRFVYNWRGKMDRFHLKKYEKFVVLTKEDASLWGNDFKNITIIPNSISFQTEKTSNPENEIVLAIGRLEYQKGFDILLEIWERIYHNNPNWQLHIYGDGQDKEKLLSIIRQKMMTESVRIFPPTKNIEQVLLSGSIYAMSSRFEGFPMILLEAMECGLPCVSFACKCGPRDIILDSEDGCLIDAYNVEFFAKKLNELMQKKELRSLMGNKAKQNVQRFSESKVMKKWEDLFLQLTKNKL